MSTAIVIALDIGGTFIKAGVVYNGELLLGTIHEYPSGSDRLAHEVLDHFTDIILDQAKRSGKLDSAAPKLSLGVGFAFPGPFDYEQGISYIQGLDKYESLYGLSVRDELLDRLQRTSLVHASESMKLRFENDARLFGLGASTTFPNERLISLTIGTGLGSAFIESGKLVTEGEGVPADGYLYRQPYGGSFADDIFSRRGILAIAADAAIDIAAHDVKDIAGMARGGNKVAKAVFHSFGANLGDFLNPFVKGFKPHRIILGGQITKSYDLFGMELEQGLQQGITIQAVDNPLHHTFLGIHKLFST